MRFGVLKISNRVEVCHKALDITRPFLQASIRHFEQGVIERLCFGWISRTQKEVLAQKRVLFIPSLAKNCFRYDGVGVFGLYAVVNAPATYVVAEHFVSRAEHR